MGIIERKNLSTINKIYLDLLKNIKIDRFYAVDLRSTGIALVADHTQRLLDKLETLGFRFELGKFSDGSKYHKGIKGYVSITLIMA